MLCSPLQLMWNLYPLGGSASSLVYRLVSSSDTICNSSSPPLANIVCFGMLRIVVNLTIFEIHLFGREFHTLISNVSLFFPTDTGTHIIDNAFKVLKIKENKKEKEKSHLFAHMGTCDPQISSFILMSFLCMKNIPFSYHGSKSF